MTVITPSPGMLNYNSSPVIIIFPGSQNCTFINRYDWSTHWQGIVHSVMCYESVLFIFGCHQRICLIYSKPLGLSVIPVKRHSYANCRLGWSGNRLVSLEKRL